MNSVIFLTIVLLALSSYFFGRKKALAIRSSNTRLTALPKFYGYYLAIWCAAPAFIIFALWSIFEPTVVKYIVLQSFSDQGLIEGELNLIFEKAKSLSRGQFSGEITKALQAAADKYSYLQSTASASTAVIVLCLLIASIAYAYNRLSKNTKTREPVEIFLQWLFFFASLAAILTTVGIVFSLLCQTLELFQIIPVFDY